jgi:hypothetical protein
MADPIAHKSRNERKGERKLGTLTETVLCLIERRRQALGSEGLGAGQERSG